MVRELRKVLVLWEVGIIAFCIYIIAMGVLGRLPWISVFYWMIALLLFAFAPMPETFLDVVSLFCAAGVVIAFPLLLLAHFHIIHLPYEFYEFLNFLILLLGGTIFLLIIFDND
jgi:hypothetical protein